MVSVCPHCLKEVEHEDHLFEVACSCGTRFNPFDVPPLTGMTDSAPGGSPETETVMENQVEDFSESNATFQEIRDFGETLGTPEENFQEAPLTKKTETSAKTKPAAAPATSGASSSDFIFTTGDRLEGYKVDGYLGFVSSAADIDLASEHPLAPLVDRLTAQATSRGANAILSFQWTLTSDGSKVLASGNAVRCSQLG